MTDNPQPTAQEYRVVLALKYISYAPLILLVLVFATHAMQGVTGSQEMTEIVNVLGLGGAFTAFLVVCAGVHDGAVTLLLLAKGKLMPALPWWTVFLYAGLWPIVPRAMIWRAGGPFEWFEVLIFAGLAGAAYAAHLYRARLKLSHRPA